MKKNSALSASTETEKKPARKVRFFWIGQIFFLIALVMMALHWSDGQVLLSLITHIQLKRLGLAVLLQLGTYVCVTAIWKVVLQSCGVFISTPNLFALSLAKLFSDQTVPSFGLSGSVVAMRGFIRRKSTAAAAAAAVIMNTTSRYLPYFLLFTTAIGIVWKNHMLNRGLRYLAITFTILILFLTLAVLALIWTILNKKAPKFIQRIPKLAGFLKTVQTIPQNIFKNVPLWLLAFSANAAIFLLDSSTLWVLLSSLGTAVQLSHVFASFMISSAVTDLAILPGRVGVFESSSIALLHLFGIPIEQAITATILFRGLTYWLPMIPGFIITRREF